MKLREILVRHSLLIGLFSLVAACGGPLDESLEEPGSLDTSPETAPSLNSAAPVGVVGPMDVAGCTKADWDAGVKVVLNPHTVQPYRGEVGWTGGATHVTFHIHCEKTWYGADNDDLWIYWDNAFVANPANKDKIRIRYQGTNAACRDRIASAGGAGTYFNDGAAGSADNMFVPGRKPYLRVVLGYACIYEAHNIVIVWP